MKIQWPFHNFSKFQNTSEIVFATCWPCFPQVENYNTAQAASKAWQGFSVVLSEAAF